MPTGKLRLVDRKGAWPDAGLAYSTAVISLRVRKSWHIRLLQLHLPEESRYGPATLVQCSLLTHVAMTCVLLHCCRKTNELVQNLQPQGCTALGPALAVSCGLVAATPHSEVVLCTDGQPNAGIGSLSSGAVTYDAQFYTKVCSRW